MRTIRVLLALTGVGFGLWGLWLVRDFTSLQLISTGWFLIGGVIVHDAILAPITVGLGVLAARLLPSHFRAAAAGAFLIWATLTVAFFNVISGTHAKSDNQTVLHRPYLLSWLILTGVLIGIMVVAARRRRRSNRPAPVPAD
jgi:glucan phosphoethanolaminetransferase (alkaline phosphatase superfamily)